VILGNLSKNAENAARLVREIVKVMPETKTCRCGSALKHALITDRAAIPQSAKDKLRLLIGKYVSN
jgi:5'-methylthioadenosine phosphorylase